MVNLLQGLWAGDPAGGHLLKIGVLAGMLAAAAISARTFRWD